MTTSAEARDPDAMSVEELRAEVWFWRENTAATMNGLTSAIGRMLEPGGKRRGIERLRRRVAQLRELLITALAGNVYEASCEACGAPVKPGQAVISDVECGEMHADCANGGYGRYRPGDKVFMEPEAIVWEGEGPKPDHIVCHASSRLYTTAEIVERVQRAGVMQHARQVTPRAEAAG